MVALADMVAIEATIAVIAVIYPMVTAMGIAVVAGQVADMATVITTGGAGRYIPI
jgi:hypothetical protein